MNFTRGVLLIVIPTLSSKVYTAMFYHSEECGKGTEVHSEPYVVILNYKNPGKYAVVVFNDLVVGISRQSIRIFAFLNWNFNLMILHSKKLDHYGIRGKTKDWIASFLHNRQQRVVIEGDTSEKVPVTSGVPQGSVLGPSLFILYINDIATKLNSTVRLFADDTVAYLAIKGSKDAESLQQDLTKLGEWEKKWCMEFHPSKCQVISITKCRNTIEHKYTLHGHQLEHVREAKYLGLNITNDMKWSTHIDKIIGKASRTLGFLKRNLQINQPKLKEQAYKSLVRPLLEYSSTVWDPDTKKDTDRLEMIQRRSARYVLNRYRNTSSVGSMLEQLKWQTLETRRKHARLTMLYKISKQQVDTPGLKSLLQPITRPSRHHNSKAYQIPETSKEYIKNSFFPRTIREWNVLPESAVNSPSIDSFKNSLCKYCT